MRTVFEVTMVSEVELERMERWLPVATGSSWRVGSTTSGDRVVSVQMEGAEDAILRVMHDDSPAPVGDVEFIAHIRDDLERLIAAVRQVNAVDDVRLAEIAGRVAGASPGPWPCFLESDGGMGGCNVIWITEEDGWPDLYLWLDDELAPDPDWEIVSHARDDIPRLLGALTAAR
jgi:hypothetical protein